MSIRPPEEVFADPSGEEPAEETVLLSYDSRYCMSIPLCRSLSLILCRHPPSFLPPPVNSSLRSTLFTPSQFDCEGLVAN